jgi:DNA repair exonuclease SbcCD nuclease subunit
MNSRLADATNCIEQVITYCIKNKVDVALFGGDLFHVRRNINVTAFNAVYRALDGFECHGIPLAMIHGNHDQADRKGDEHSLLAMSDIVFDKPTWYTIRDRWGNELPLDVLGIPYTENIEHLRDVVNRPCPNKSHHKIMLGHFGVQGAKVGADFVYINPHDAAVDDLNLGAFDRAYLGHYHLHQKIAPNAWYIGAPLQHNWGDAGQLRGFLAYDTETRSHEFIPLKAPRFVCDPDTDADVSDCFVRYTSDRTWSADEIEACRQSIRARSLEIVPPKEHPTDGSENVHDSPPDASMYDVLERYVKSGIHPTNGLEKEYLLQLGREILEEVENDDT